LVIQALALSPLITSVKDGGAVWAVVARNSRKRMPIEVITADNLKAWRDAVMGDPVFSFL
jgi:hypothetical protein